MLSSDGASGRIVWVRVVSESENERLRRLLVESRAEADGLRRAQAGTPRDREQARIIDEITGEDGGTNPFAAAVRTTRMPMVIADPRLHDTPIVFVNDAFCRLCGYAREEILGQNCRFLQGPDTDRETVRTIRAAVDTGTGVHTDVLNYRKDGRTFWNRLLMAPVRDSEGQLAYFFASQVDVTLERERLEGLETHNAALMAEVSDRLHEQEEIARRLSFATEAGRLGVWELDLATGGLTTSPVFREDHGASREAVLDLDGLDRAVHPEDREARHLAVARCVEDGSEIDVEYRVGAPGAPVRWVHVRAQVVAAEDGAPLRVAGVSFDVTERKTWDLRRRVKTELADVIRDVEDPAALAHAAAEVLGRALGVTRAGFGVVDASDGSVSIERDWTVPGARGLSGHLRFGGHGSLLADLLRGDVVAIPDVRSDPRTRGDAGAVEALGIRSMLDLPVAEGSGSVALLHLDHDVARHWTDQEVDLVRDAAERVQVAMRRRTAERELRELAGSLERQVEERTRERDQLWALSEDLLVIADYEGRLLRTSPSWCRVFGYGPETLSGTDYRDLIHPDDVARAEADVLRMRRTRHPVMCQVRMTAADGAHRTIAWQLSPDPDGVRVIGTGRDVTAERARAVELEVAQDSLRQSQKMEAVGQLTGGVAHDFNNLLTVIRSSVDLLKRPSLSEERRQRYVTAISDTAARATKLTGQLLAFARRQSLRPEVFDVNASAVALADMLRTLTGSRIAVSVSCSPEACRVDADPSQFDTAVVNLAVNARDAMGGEGALTIAVARASAIPAHRAQPRTEGDFVTLSVTDTGTGIAPSDVERIFEPFFTTKGVGQGTGLGLSQVFGFVRQSGGDVVVSSLQGEGTTFTLYLPRAVGEVLQNEPTGAPGDAADGGGISVLVVEDNVEVGASAVQGLEEVGFSTVLAADAGAALDVLARDPGRFDVVFSDVVMPGMSGIELGKLLRTTYPGLPVVLASGYSHVLAQEGPHGFELVHKPYSVDDLSRVLRDAVSSSRGVAA